MLRGQINKLQTQTSPLDTTTLWARRLVRSETASLTTLEKTKQQTTDFNSQQQQLPLASSFPCYGVPMPGASHGRFFKSPDRHRMAAYTLNERGKIINYKHRLQFVRPASDRTQQNYARLKPTVTTPKARWPALSVHCFPKHRPVDQMTGAFIIKIPLFLFFLSNVWRSLLTLYSYNESLAFKIGFKLQSKP